MSPVELSKPADRRPEDMAEAVELGCSCSSLVAVRSSGILRRFKSSACSSTCFDSGASSYGTYLSFLFPVLRDSLVQLLALSLA